MINALAKIRTARRASEFIVRRRGERGRSPVAASVPSLARLEHAVRAPAEQAPGTAGKVNGNKENKTVVIHALIRLPRDPIGFVKTTLISKINTSVRTCAMTNRPL